MNRLTIRLGTMADTKARFVDAAKRALAGEGVEAAPTLNFSSYDDMHRVLAPSRLAIVKVLAGQGALSIREVARRVERDVQAVHRDVTTLANAGVIDRTEQGVEFPYRSIHFGFELLFDAESEAPLSELLAAITSENSHEEADFGVPRGQETF